jgi:predicted regulator of Ras-like GTPase activity (Roadblock/LC7/MglB family)
MMSRLEQLQKVLDGFKDEASLLQGAALFSDDGLIIASSLPDNFDEMRVCAGVSSMLTAYVTAGAELNRGKLQELIIRGEGGYAIFAGASRGLVLIVFAGKNAKLGGVLLTIREALDVLNRTL